MRDQRRNLILSPNDHLPPHHTPCYTLECALSPQPYLPLLQGDALHFCSVMPPPLSLPHHHPKTCHPPAAVCDVSCIKSYFGTWASSLRRLNLLQHAVVVAMGDAGMESCRALQKYWAHHCFMDAMCGVEKKIADSAGGKVSKGVKFLDIVYQYGCHGKIAWVMRGIQHGYQVG